MDQTPKILRLTNGKTLIGLVDTKKGLAGSIFEVYQPLEMVHILDVERKHESISLKPWFFFAEEDTFVIQQQHVMSSATLQNQYHEMYFEVATKAFSPDEYEGSYVEYDEEEDAQTIQELYEEVMGMFKDKRTIH